MIEVERRKVGRLDDIAGQKIAGVEFKATFGVVEPGSQIRWRNQLPEQRLSFFNVDGARLLARRIFRERSCHNGGNLPDARHALVNQTFASGLHEQHAGDHDCERHRVEEDDLPRKTGDAAARRFRHPAF